jgi:hypothetical protein
VRFLFFCLYYYKSSFAFDSNVFRKKVTISNAIIWKVLGNSLAPFRFLTPFSIRPFLVWRRLYGEKTVREAERAWFLSAGEESEALIRVDFDSLGQKQRVFEPYSLSLSSIVAAAISQNLFLEYNN